MSFKEAKQLIRNSINVLRNAKGNALLVATKKLEATFKRRIFTQGKASNNSKIGTYSTEPMYVSLAGAKSTYGSQIRTSSLRGKGNSGSGKFKNGKNRRSMYFPDGYSGFRKQMGRQNKFVDLNLTGSTEKSIQTGKRANNRVVMGFISNRKTSIADNLERKYGKSIFAVTKSEEKDTRTDFLEEVVRNLDRVVR